MVKRASSVLVVLVVIACMTMAGISPAGAGSKKKFCKYVKTHQMQFTQVFSPDTPPEVAAKISEPEIMRLLKRAPKVLVADFETFLDLLSAIESSDTAAIEALAPAAGPASERILDYVELKCGVATG